MNAHPQGWNRCFIWIGLLCKLFISDVDGAVYFLTLKLFWMGGDFTMQAAGRRYGCSPVTVGISSGRFGGHTACNAAMKRQVETFKLMPYIGRA